MWVMRGCVTGSHAALCTLAHSSFVGSMHTGHCILMVSGAILNASSSTCSKDDGGNQMCQTVSLRRDRSASCLLQMDRSSLILDYTYTHRTPKMDIGSQRRSDRLGRRSAECLDPLFILRGILWIDLGSLNSIPQM